MQGLGFRFCSVTREAEALAKFLGEGLGLPEREMPTDSDAFSGAVFPAGESWIEIWPEGPEMPVRIMLQIVDDDADAWAEQARKNGLAPDGPTDAYGDRIYFLKAPSGLPVSLQSKAAT